MITLCIVHASSPKDSYVRGCVRKVTYTYLFGIGGGS